MGQILYTNMRDFAEPITCDQILENLPSAHK